MAEKKIIYVPENGFMQGIPARDLSLSEWEEIAQEERQKALDLGIYRIEKPTKAAIENKSVGE